MKLNDLGPNEGSKKSRKRVGRGISAGQGKTAGRGTKGQGARSGGGKGAYFEGGQLPLARRLPFKRGFTNIRRVEYKAVNLDRLAEFEFGDETVTPELMAAIGLIKKSSDRVAILGGGEIAEAITVQAHRFSATAKEKIEAAGGKAEVIPFNA
ncbi:MAG: 50S ribosomal protein L15 [Anaerolineales bacterium]|uniref:50S ribosomal protein L15 n=1 Tax=Promineifilum sp. TaxID=2664178 RepID=UPI001E01D85A|nr:50S ribosomal protein L15 [Anaerolineales bacterium]MCB8936285.1 50S ribosomal protein L15 [Promineifilum sp.]MCO5180204.1 50S ribosomal protein L15 [Promineifilum sp.]